MKKCSKYINNICRFFVLAAKFQRDACGIMQGLKRIGILISENFYKSNDFLILRTSRTLRTLKEAFKNSRLLCMQTFY